MMTIPIPVVTATVVVVLPETGRVGIGVGDVLAEAMVVDGLYETSLEAAELAHPFWALTTK